MAKYLVMILTSSKMVFLKECYKSIKNQLKSGIDYDIIINVNTLKEEYYKEVLEQFKDVTVIRTESNGKPGKGHNSCHEYFRDHIEYDYLINIDGDDFLFPFFMQRLEKYITTSYDPDIILLPFSDMINNDFYKNQLHYPFKKGYYYTNVDIMNLMEDVYKYKLSPFTNELSNINVAGRLLLTSRRALELKLKYQENVFAFDDLLPFLQILEYNNLFPHKLNIYFVEDYYLYLYNRINEDSTSAELLNPANIKQNMKDLSILINKELEHKFLLLRKNWNLRSIKVLHNPGNKDLLLEKFKFVKELMQNLDIKELDNFTIDQESLNNHHHFLTSNGYTSIYRVKKQ